ncbi:hypothetical protein [Novosphingobium jiangmenense]|uniref:Uncharacterized protein n=1 Tax=Novosphingobium jiangmenense TaxID=2791981 RepID=A0ABS0HHB4_9SPHN|nr:hypothetical protein [Novosphingobium jiangmenense]MBF9151359.1 hypothetical protein [Novosphingobium jiangmenense]
MALWQFSLDLIPASAATVEGTAVIRLRRDQLDAIPLDLSSEDAGRLFGWLNRLLPEAVSWSDSLRIWGDVRKDDVKVFLSSHGIESVQYRLNAADLSIHLISGICAIARKLGCVFASSECGIVQPTDEAVIRAIMQSPATRFVQDPKGFLEAAVLSDRARG